MRFFLSSSMIVQSDTNSTKQCIERFCAHSKLLSFFMACAEVILTLPTEELVMSQDFPVHWPKMF